MSLNGAQMIVLMVLLCIVACVAALYSMRDK